MEGRRGGAGATTFEEGAQGYEETGEKVAKSRGKREASPIAKTRGTAAVLDGPLARRHRSSRSTIEGRSDAAYAVSQADRRRQTASIRASRRFFGGDDLATVSRPHEATRSAQTCGRWSCRFAGCQLSPAMGAAVEVA
jgi:hypothetical protein